MRVGKRQHSSLLAHTFVSITITDSAGSHTAVLCTAYKLQK